MHRSRPFLPQHIHEAQLSFRQRGGLFRRHGLLTPSTSLRDFSVMD
jgi:hypothetical protein